MLAMVTQTSAPCHDLKIFILGLSTAFIAVFR